MKTLLAASAIALAATTSAMASGPVAPPPPPVVVTVTPSYDWSGFYAGIGLGTHSGDMYDIGGPYEVTGSSGVAFAGYRRNFGAYVLGGELSTTFMTSAQQIGFPTWQFSRMTDLRVTAGRGMGRVLPYVAVGYTNTGFVAGPFGTHNYNGWNAGFGLDMMMSDHFFVGAEYIWRSLESTTTAGWTGDFGTLQLRGGWRF